MGIIGTILAVAGGIAIIGSAGAVIYKVVRPAFSVVKRVGVLETKADKDYATLQRQADFDAALCEALVALLEHAKDGNHTGQMETALATLHKFLIRR
jgi:hypothetical protein